MKIEGTRVFVCGSFEGNLVRRILIQVFLDNVQILIRNNQGINTIFALIMHPIQFIINKYNLFDFATREEVVK